ncbi:MAG TPA: PD-(D/E)XK nuclease family protein, partial [Caulobacteraceae bacterium]|nr:PD-(D/E)XK nuclease family protein [Caulobacteraceae bacterium]
ALILFQPTRLDPADAQLLAALAERLPLRVALAFLPDPQDLGSQPALDQAELLGQALGAQVPRPALLPRLPLPPETAILRAPDPREEVLNVVRAVAALLESAQPLYRVAILYRQAEAYAGLVRDTLDRAAIPWYSLSGLPLLDSRPAQMLLDLLRLPERAFSREAVLQVIAASPLAGSDSVPSPATWERLSREANIVRGAGQWTTRLEVLASRFEARQTSQTPEPPPELASPTSAAPPNQPTGAAPPNQPAGATPPGQPTDGPPDQPTSAVPEPIGAAPPGSPSFAAPPGIPAAAAPPNQPTTADRARHMAAFVAQMADALRPPPDGSPWPAFISWADGAHVRFCGQPEAWPEPERRPAAEVGEALASLAEAARVEPATTLPVFLAALEAALRERARPAGQLGHGVVVGPVSAVSGMSFDHIFVVGLTEGAFPPVPPLDPFFPTEDEDILHLRQHYRQRDRQAFLTAMAAAGRQLTLSTVDSADGRAAFPSRWLLEVAAVLLGQDHLHASGFAALGASGQLRPWLRVVRSAQEGVLAAPAMAGLDDRRLAEVLAWTRADRPLAEHALARRDDLPVGISLVMETARNSRQLTFFDGFVGGLASRAQAIARLFNGERPMSATALQKWAGCPFSYFLEQVLRVRAAEPPEDRWTIDPAERGTLIHAILEDFLRSLASVDPPLGSRAYDDSDRRLLRDVADRHFEELRASGLAGNPLVWESMAADIWADLETFLRQDQAWRAEHGWQPVRFEQSFGWQDQPDSWPALDIEAGGLSLRFRGLIDRIDVSENGHRAFLYDYKTGSSQGYKGIAADPVIQGRALQLALYAEAVRRNLDEPDVGSAYWFISSRGGFAMEGPRQPAPEVTVRLNGVLGSIATGIQAGL